MPTVFQLVNDELTPWLKKAVCSFPLNAVSTTRNVVPTAFGVYLIYCQPTGQFYVGSTAGKGGLRNRIGWHLSYLRSGKHPSKRLLSAFRRYGEEAFVCYLLAEITAPKKCLGAEQEYLNALKPFGNRGFNTLTHARNSLGLRHSPKTREKMRAVWKTEERQEKHLSANRDKWKNPEYRQKLIESRAVAFKLEKDGVVHEGKNLSEFARQHGLDPHLLSSVIAGRILHHRRWTRAGTILSKDMVRSPEGEIFTIHLDERAPFAKSHGLDQGALFRLCRGKAKSHLGWTIVNTTI